jgi:chromosome partitioning protein
METIGLIRRNFNPHLQVNGILFTMYDNRTNLSQQVVAEVRAHFPDLVLEETIPRNIRLSEAPSFGKPILLYDVRSRGAEAYFNLAREIISRVKESTR